MSKLYTTTLTHSDECKKEPKTYKGNDFVTDALRHSKVKLTWDQDDPNRAKITRRALTREEIEEEDFGNLVAASSDSEPESEIDEEAPDAEKKKSKKEKIKERKEKLRALLLGGDDETGDIWGKAGTAWQDELADIKGASKKDKEAVEITFKPGLSMVADDDNLTSLERYQMRLKEKKKAKKERMEAKRTGKDGNEDKEDKKDGDDFFGDSDSDDDEPAPKKRARSPSPAEVVADDHGLVEDQAAHFNIKDAIAAEKAAGKKRKRNRKSKKGQEREAELGPEGFKVDVADPRFAAMYEEPAFAVDPTHPKYVACKPCADRQGSRISRPTAKFSSAPAKRTPPSVAERLAPAASRKKRTSRPSFRASRPRWTDTSANARASTRLPTGCIMHSFHGGGRREWERVTLGRDSPRSDSLFCEGLA